MTTLSPISENLRRAASSLVPHDRALDAFNHPDVYLAAQGPRRKTRLEGAGPVETC
jgi:hypothetical protein